MTSTVEKEIQEAEQIFGNILSNGHTFLSMLDQMINRWHAAFFASLENNSPMPIELFLDETAQYTAQFIKEKYLKESFLIQAIAPFKGTLYAALRGNVILFVYRIARAVETQFIPSVFSDDKPSRVLEKIYENVYRWNELECQGRASHVKSKKSNSRQKESQNFKDRDRKKEFTNLAETIVNTILLPHGNDSLYLPLPSVAMMFISGYVSDFTCTYIVELVEKCIELMLERSTRVSVLEYIASLDPIFSISVISETLCSKSVLAQRESGEIPEEEIYLIVDQLKKIAPFFLPDEWNKYIKYLPIFDSVKKIVNQLYQKSRSPQFCWDTVQKLLLLCIEAISTYKPKLLQANINEDEVIQRLERTIKHPLILEHCLQEYMKIIESRDTLGNAEYSGEEISEAKKIGSSLAAGIKSVLIRKVSSGVKMVIDWEQNAPIVARKSAYYFLSNTVRSLLIS